MNKIKKLNEEINENEMAARGHHKGMKLFLKIPLSVDFPEESPGHLS